MVSFPSLKITAVKFILSTLLPLRIRVLYRIRSNYFSLLRQQFFKFYTPL